MASTKNFSAWLNEELRKLNTDETVFGTYIISILDGDEPLEEKSEALREILAEIINDNLDELIATIQNKWFDCHPKEDEPPKKGLAAIDVNEQLAKLLEAQKLQPTNKERHYTEEEKRIREQILSQYSESPITDEDIEDVSDEAEKPATSIERNTNAHDVMQLQKERREQARLDSAAKKQKDKDDREKQKQQREEKKEKRKTVKGERRR